MTKRKFIMSTFLTALLLGFSTLCMAQDDEFEPVSAITTIAPPSETTSSPQALTPSQEPKPSLGASHHQHAALPPLTWLNLALSLIGVALFLIGKFRYRTITLLISVAILGFYAGGCPCAVGAATKIFVDVANHSPVLDSGSLLAIAIIPTALFGRFFCGNACPIGALQEFLSPRAKPVQVPFHRERLLRRGQILLFAFLVFASLFSGTYYFERIDPFRTIFNVRGNVFQVSIAAMILLASLFVHRFFCRYLCPLAVLLNIFARFSLFKIRKAPNCTNCGRCQKRCPIAVIDETNNVDNAACIRCGECLTACKLKDRRFTA